MQEKADTFFGRVICTEHRPNGCPVKIRDFISDTDASMACLLKKLLTFIENLVMEKFNVAGSLHGVLKRGHIVSFTITIGRKDAVNG